MKFWARSFYNILQLFYKMGPLCEPLESLGRLLGLFGLFLVSLGSLGVSLRLFLGTLGIPVDSSGAATVETVSM